VIRTVDRGVDDSGTPFLVMEYVPGPTLKQLVRAEGPLPEERALELAAQLVGHLTGLSPLIHERESAS
jgi:serine/threonine protein kinase